ncbi:SWIB complex BAF60b domain-containing protein [Pseudohyphozyma bogoriensis]|nr:SWIB complex BAF60b domain-containing protein [Pseudohyphozyma bogoriensis]
MSDEIAKLLPDIRDILAHSDLQTISAKKVRKELQGRYPDLDVKTHKAEIDELTASAFASFDAQSDESDEKPLVASTPSSSKPTQAIPHHIKRPRSPSPTSSPAFPLKSNGHSKKLKHEAETDAQVAARLHAELNGVRSTRNPPKKAAWGGKKDKAKKKSSKYVDDDGEEVDGEVKAKRKAPNAGFNKLMQLSEPMAEICGTEQLSRPGVTKAIWVYIKANNLQDPNKKTDILPDATLKKILPFERINSFTMAKHLGAHLYPIEKKMED